MKGILPTAGGLHLQGSVQLKPFNISVSVQANTGRSLRSGLEIRDISDTNIHTSQEGQAAQKQGMRKLS